MGQAGYTDIMTLPRGAPRPPGRARRRRLGLFQLQAVFLDLAADLGEKLIVNACLYQRIAKPAVGRLIWHAAMQIKPAKQHEIQPNLQGSLKLRVRQAVPMTHEQTFEQNKWLIA